MPTLECHGALLFRHGVASEVDAEFLEDFLVHLAEHHCAMHLTTI